MTPATATEPPPLTGFTVAITAARRRDELRTLLERRGARVVTAPAIQIVPLEDDAELMAATQVCLDRPLDIVVATTGIGFRAWVEAADGWAMGEPLLKQLGRASLLARGPKARGAIRAAGLADDWSPASESSAEVLDYLLEQDLSGRRIAVQLHGEPLPDFVDALEATGAEVVTVPVYRWVLPEDVSPLQRLVEMITERQVDCVTFTSAPAVASLLAVAEDMGADVVSALRGSVMAACVGPVTAARLDRLDVSTTQPARARLGALVRSIVDELPARCRTLRVAGQDLQLRGYAAVVDGEPTELAPAPMAVLAALARRPGVVVPRAQLLSVLPGTSRDEHAVEMAITRLRSVLGARFVQTVVKRGYRLACEIESGDDKYAAASPSPTSSLSC